MRGSVATRAGLAASQSHGIPPFLDGFSSGRLLEMARSYPRCPILVLCGRTHGGGEIQAAEHLRVVADSTDCGKPLIRQVSQVG